MPKQSFRFGLDQSGDAEIVAINLHLRLFCLLIINNLLSMILTVSGMLRFSNGSLSIFFVFLGLFIIFSYSANKWPVIAFVLMLTLYSGQWLIIFIQIDEPLWESIAPMLALAGQLVELVTARRKVRIGRIQGEKTIYR